MRTRPETRKAFEGPITWDARKGTIWQHRQCSTPSCTNGAHWLIAEALDAAKAKRFACGSCLEKKYRLLERDIWADA